LFFGYSKSDKPESVGSNSEAQSENAERWRSKYKHVMIQELLLVSLLVQWGKMSGHDKIAAICSKPG